MSYLDIARGVTLSYERNERNEKSPGLSEVSARSVPDPSSSEVLWVHVSREEVEASAPPAGWDGTLPVACRWADLCQVLGPCPHHLNQIACHRQGENS
jgi:hypothetical protein